MYLFSRVDSLASDITLWYELECMKLIPVDKNTQKCSSTGRKKTVAEGNYRTAEMRLGCKTVGRNKRTSKQTLKIIVWSVSDTLLGRPPVIDER